ncbi:MAG: NusG domain II-containing protein [Oscillospiraceae bacterium]|nr:NusG domain II-containing protein [Oscillospiraceae bacterium]
MSSKLKSDLLLFIAIVLVAVLLFAGISALKSDGTTVVITLNGKTYTEVELSKNVEISVDGLLLRTAKSGLWTPPARMGFARSRGVSRNRASRLSACLAGWS